MIELAAQRTLVKSPPELWSEFSDSQTLGRLLEPLFGQIQITRRAPEHALAWEGDNASGTIELEPSGWGTQVRLTATVPGMSSRESAETALREVLDQVGAAHHRPFSRG
jgi:hypothetical protein